MFRGILFSLAAMTMAVPALAAELITKTSPYSVHETVDRLEAAVKEAGATVFARVDHAEGAKKVDMELRPTMLLIFGNPKLGTPAMQDAQTAGLDLPLRVLTYSDASGDVHVTYRDPVALSEDHGIAADADYLSKMAGALDKLTSKAIAKD